MMISSEHKQLPISMTSFTKMINYEIYHAIRSFLVKRRMGLVESDKFELQDIFSFTYPGIFSHPNILGFDVFDNVMFDESILFGIIRFKGERYLIPCTSFDDRGSKYYALIISGDIAGDFRPQEVAEILLKEGVLNSGYSGKILRIFYDEFNLKATFKILVPPDITLNDVYLKNKVELEDFVKSIKEGKRGLRYLFVGEPGTGKTATIKALIRECININSNLTIFVVDAGCQVPLEILFEYAEIFRPVLVCIDDIDLIVSRRDIIPNSKNLSTALQALDGFINNVDTFLIATTNDRYLVDTALRRPGRFDLIIEFENLDPQFYYSLVLRETGDERLAQVFKNDNIVKRLSNLKVTGAFIVTLVGYLSRERFKHVKYETETVIKAIERLYHSFKKEVNSKELIGF